MRIIINGILGRMGQAITRGIMNQPEMELVGGIDTQQDTMISGLKISSELDSLDRDADVIIDFSTPDGFNKALTYAIKHGKQFISGTTGLSTDDNRRLQMAAEKIPLLYASNFSLGVNLMFYLLDQAMDKIKHLPFDIEILEVHHRNKKDAPSGTAETMRQLVQNHMESPLIEEHGRHGITDTRNGKLGIHAIRGGSVIGKHEVLFLGPNENLTLSHEALSRQVFVDGIMEAVKFLHNQPIGLYSMQDVLNLTD